MLHLMSQIQAGLSVEAPGPYLSHLQSLISTGSGIVL